MHLSLNMSISCVDQLYRDKAAKFSPFFLYPNPRHPNP